MYKNTASTIAPTCIQQFFPYQTVYIDRTYYNTDFQFLNFERSFIGYVWCLWFRSIALALERGFCNSLESQPMFLRYICCGYGCSAWRSHEIVGMIDRDELENERVIL